MLSEIAAVLDVNINSLGDPSLENTETFIHLLFDLEQESKKHHTNNFSIIVVPDELGNPQLALQFHNHLLNKVLSEWQLRRKELNDEIITEEEYAEWMMSFPATSDDCGKSEPVKKWRKCFSTRLNRICGEDTRKRGKDTYLFGNTCKRRKTIQFSVRIAVNRHLLVG